MCTRAASQCGHGAGEKELRLRAGQIVVLTKARPRQQFWEGFIEGENPVIPPSPSVDTILILTHEILHDCVCRMRVESSREECSSLQLLPKCWPGRIARLRPQWRRGGGDTRRRGDGLTARRPSQSRNWRVELCHHLRYLLEWL